MYLSDSRGGVLRIDHPDARFYMPKTSQSNQAMFLVEQKEDALYLQSTLKIPALFPTHGPASVRVLANYAGDLAHRNAIVLYRNDLVGHAFGHCAGRILLQFARPRLLGVAPAAFARRDPGRLPPPLRPGELHRAPQDDPLVITGTRLLESHAGIWGDMDGAPLLDLLDQKKLPMLYLNDRRLPEEVRVRLIPLRKREESFDSYAQRTGY